MILAWQPFQLDDEMDQSIWHIMCASKDIILDNDIGMVYPFFSHTHFLLIFSFYKKYKGIFKLIL